MSVYDIKLKSQLKYLSTVALLLLPFYRQSILGSLVKNTHSICEKYCVYLSQDKKYVTTFEKNRRRIW